MLVMLRSSPAVVAVLAAKKGGGGGGQRKGGGRGKVKGGRRGQQGRVGKARMITVVARSWLPSSLSYSLDNVIAADTVTRFKVPCLHLVFGRQSVDENCVQHAIGEGQPCCTHFCAKILDPTHLVERVATWRYHKTIKAPGEVGLSPRRFEGGTTQRERLTLPSARYP